MSVAAYRRAGLLSFTTAFATLLAQVLVHRVVSAKLLTNYAFLVISLTMLGFAASGVLLTRWGDEWRARRRDMIPAFAALFALSLLVATAVFCRAGVWPQTPVSRGDFLHVFMATVPLSLLFAAPFTCSGLILGLLLSSPDLDVKRIYGLDFLGSALGTVMVIPVISQVGPEKGLLATAGVLLLVVVLAAPARAVWSWGLVGLGALAIVGFAVFDGAFVIRSSPESLLARTEQPGSGYELEYAAWDPVARIEVVRIPTPEPERSVYPVLVGKDPAFLKRIFRAFMQNNTAGTMAVAYDGHPASLDGIEQTIYCAAYVASGTAKPKVAIVGVGAGMDVLTALRYDAGSVTGVEVNAATVGILTRTYKEFFAPWVGDPRVTLVNDEGRHYLASHPGKYDVIQLSGVDSFAGTAAAAHVFTESYLYTGEAFDLYLSRLTDEGVMNVMRFEYPEMPREMMRALATTTAALRRLGVERPAANVVVVGSRQGNFTAILVKRTPFVAAEMRRLAAWVRESALFTLVAGPGFTPTQPNPYHLFLALGSEKAEQELVDKYPFNIRPVTDDNPFFFRHSYWWHLAEDRGAVGQSVPVLEYSLLILLALTAVAAAAFVYLPLRLLEGTRSRPPARVGIFFAALGLGFMALEIALIQKFGLLLGHPNYALSVVLGALLLSSGVGALASDLVMARLRGPRRVSLGVAGIVGVLAIVVLPLVHHLFSLPFPARALLVCACVFPLGVLLGTFMPWGLGPEWDLLGGRAHPEHRALDHDGNDGAAPGGCRDLSDRGAGGDAGRHRRRLASPHLRLWPAQLR
ncbi:MAG TPA: hypothetical protein VMV21_11800 [Vicinamibacteria bacterium]|nr:hypothetical protein [Vicinamibacteria bacterium]